MNLSRRGFAALIAAAVLPGALGQGSAFAQVVILERPMPPPRMEVIPVAPGPGYNWVPGHWAWRGAEWVWIPGHHIQGVVAPMPAPLVETMPLSDAGRKPAARSAATRIWLEASAGGRARVAALRAPDFYGPGVGLSFLGDTAIGAMAKGKAAFFIGSPDIPHDYAYVPDIARAATTLMAAPDSAYGQAWHVPCAPTRTTREILQCAADVLGVPLKLNVLPELLLGPLGLLVPFLREAKEMRFTFDRPYHVNSRKFAEAFWSDPTPFEEGVRKTALAFRAAGMKA